MSCRHCSSPCEEIQISAAVQAAACVLASDLCRCLPPPPSPPPSPGQVIKGFAVMRTLEGTETKSGDQPVQPCLIDHCGELAEGEDDGVPEVWAPPLGPALPSLLSFCSLLCFAQRRRTEKRQRVPNAPRAAPDPPSHPPQGHNPSKESLQAGDLYPTLTSVLCNCAVGSSQRWIAHFNE